MQVSALGILQYIIILKGKFVCLFVVQIYFLKLFKFACSCIKGGPLKPIWWYFSVGAKAD